MAARNHEPIPPAVQIALDRWLRGRGFTLLEYAVEPRPFAALAAAVQAQAGLTVSPKYVGQRCAALHLPGFRGPHCPQGWSGRPLAVTATYRPYTGHAAEWRRLRSVLATILTDLTEGPGETPVTALALAVALRARGLRGVTVQAVTEAAGDWLAARGVQKTEPVAGGQGGPACPPSKPA